jgi:flagellar operon protein
LFAALLDVEQRRGIEARDLKVSGHASSRLREAGRTLTEDEVSLVNTAVDRAASKGARESLIVMNGMALVVSVPNRTVITAVTGERCKENVFTNIDSAIIMSGLDLS